MTRRSEAGEAAAVAAAAEAEAEAAGVNQARAQELVQASEPA
jgi:hypothetical protein